MQTHTVNTCEHGLDLWFPALAKALNDPSSCCSCKVSLTHNPIPSPHCLFSLSFPFLSFALLHFLYRCILILQSNGGTLLIVNFTQRKTYMLLNKQKCTHMHAQMDLLFHKQGPSVSSLHYFLLIIALLEGYSEWLIFFVAHPLH